jgi:peptidoglycan/LPS O-acetylase OafA/YrhL
VAASYKLTPQRMPESECPPEPLIRKSMPELDTLRGIAVLGVLFLHGFSWRYGNLRFTAAARVFMLLTQPGWIGVNLFFVLSGFLISGILLDSKNHPHYYRRFYTRRALRILPAYYSLLVLLALLHQATASFLALSFFYLANLTDFFGVAMDYGPLWSLAVEEHFYIVWPAIVLRFRARTLAIFLMATCVLVPIARVIAFRYHHGAGLDWYTWFVADGLATGSLLAIVLRARIQRKQVVIATWLLLTLVPVVALAGAPFGILTAQRLLGAAFQYTLVNLFFAGFLLLFLHVGTSAQKNYVNNSVLRFFGYISYGVYLIHFLVFRLYDLFANNFWPGLQPTADHFSLVCVRFVVVAAASTGLAYLSRKYYEERFLRLKDRFAPGS